MKLKIKLKNPKYCDGCPLKFVSYGSKCILYGKLEDIRIAEYNYKAIRPQICIKENGE